MTTKEAEHYIGCGIKEGHYDPDQFEGWSDTKLIEFAEREGSRGDAMMENRMEEE